MDGESIVLRVQSSRNHFEVLGLEVLPGSQVHDQEVVKKQYKRIALLVHPDKCSHPLAEETFKKLGKAFEVLSDSASQLRYKLTLRGGYETITKKKRGRGDFTAKDRQQYEEELKMRKERHKERKRRRKEAREKEEEEMRQKLKEQMLKDYEKTFQANTAAWQKWKAAATKERYKKTQKQTQQEEVKKKSEQTRKEEEAEEMRKTEEKKRQATQEEEQYSDSGSEEDSEEDRKEEDEEDNINGTDTGAFICYICLRRFKTREMLQKHEAQSKLHQSNMEILRSRSQS